MIKNPITLAPYLKSDRPRRKVLPVLSLFVAVPLLAPIVLDATALCYARWSEMLGTPTAVCTPTLDAISERVAEGREDLRYHVSSFFHRVPWNPRVVLPIAMLVALLAILMLRR